VKLKLTVDGKIYEVDVEATEPEAAPPIYSGPPMTARMPASPPPGPPPKPGASGSAETVDDENKVCRSPISGVVVRVQVQTGQEIKAHDVLMVLEAMKMETVITSPINGKVANIRVAPGDSVQGRQVLVEFA